MEKKSLRTKKIISYKNMGDKLSIVSNTCHLCKSIIKVKKPNFVIKYFV